MQAPTVVITGGNRGIGRSITEAFVLAGYSVVVGARTPNDVETIDPKRVTFCPIEVSDERSHIALADLAIELTGKLDCWVNNAGASAWKPITEIDNTFFNEMINVNLKGAFWGCKAASQKMSSTGGSIINISSIAGKRGSSNNSMYCAAKFGVNGLTQSLAKELGSLGIRVNAICPVLIKTDGLMGALAEQHSPGFDDPERFINDFAEANSATGHLPTGHDVGAMAVFLSSKNSKSITGQCINVDCGVFPQ